MWDEYKIILAETNEGGLILEPFSRSGTAAVVAEQQNRKWIRLFEHDSDIDES